MSSFATIFGFTKMMGNDTRPSLIYNQYKVLAHYFPYFQMNSQEFLINSWYCGHFCNLKWTMPNGLKLHQRTFEEMVNITRFLGNQFPKGKAFYLPSYINMPMVFMPFIKEIKAMFQLRDDYVSAAKEVIHEARKDSDYTAIIGIHVRLTGSLNAYY